MPMVNPKNIQIRNIKQTEQVVLMYLGVFMQRERHTHVTIINEKEAMNLKTGYMEEFGER